MACSEQKDISSSIFWDDQIFSYSGLPRDTGVTGIPLFQPPSENYSISSVNNLIGFDRTQATCEIYSIFSGNTLQVAEVPVSTKMGLKEYGRVRDVSDCLVQFLTSIPVSPPTHGWGRLLMGTHVSGCMLKERFYRVSV